MGNPDNGLSLGQNKGNSKNGYPNQMDENIPTVGKIVINKKTDNGREKGQKHYFQGIDLSQSLTQLDKLFFWHRALFSLIKITRE